MLLAAAFAFASAAAFATGSALQHRAAGSPPDAHERSSRFVGRLIRQPSWVIGLSLSGLAFVLHAVALSQGDLALVQPVIVSGIVFAVLIRSALEHHFPPPRRTVAWLILTCIGLATFLTARPASIDQQANEIRATFVLVAGGLVALVAMLLARRSQSSRRRGILLALATGTLYGLIAGDVKLVLARQNGFFGTLTSWPLWTLIGAGVWAVLMNQRAYQSAKLWVTAPVVSIGEALVSIAFGIVVFNEVSHSTPVELLGQGLGLALVALGVIKLASTQDDVGSSAEDRVTAVR